MRRSLVESSFFVLASVDTISQMKVSGRIRQADNTPDKRRTTLFLTYVPLANTATPP
jgi:hypothetical protein